MALSAPIPRKELYMNQDLFNELPPTGFVRGGDIWRDRKRGTTGLIPISKSAWLAGVKEGRFPKPLKLGPKTTVWRVEDIRDLIQRFSADGGVA